MSSSTPPAKLVSGRVNIFYENISGQFVSAANIAIGPPNAKIVSGDAYLYYFRSPDERFTTGGKIKISGMSSSAPPPPAPPPSNATDRTNLTFSANGYTSTYHLYAGGLNWSKPVGLLLYTDGSGEYGLKNPRSTYLLAGSNGMIAVAKRHNMVLLTPLSPNKNCADGDGSCWYMGDPVGYAKWAESLVTSIQSQYRIDKKRVAVGGYSSGAQFTTEWWVPSGAAQRTMIDGVIVAISYGGSPKMSEVLYLPGFKTNIQMNWNVGDRDSSYQGDGKYGVKAGYDHYTRAGFRTSLTVIPGKGHDRSGEFGGIMDAQISRAGMAVTSFNVKAYDRIVNRL